MFRIPIIKCLALLLITSSAVAQKVKYKEIFALLSTKQFDQAEPFLKTYLKDNTENPNAYLFMGLIYKEKAEADDVLLSANKSVQHMDSAILYFDNALKILDEKEVRKNKDYYVSYNRRDLRTGEFGVKLSDVQFDLEKKITGLRERIDKVKMVNYYFAKAEDLYKKSFDLFEQIQKKYPGERELYLRADETMINSLTSLSLKFDSCTKMFDNYKISLGNLEKTKYNQTWNPVDIVDFKNDGKEMTDFYNDDVKVWDYKKFATKALEVIEKDVKPTQENLMKYDIEINKLRQKMETDSVSVKNDLTKLIEKMLVTQLKKFDPDPMPMDVFALKISDLEYKSTLLENKSIKGSDDVYKLLAAIQSEVKYLHRVDSIADKLTNRNLDEDIVNYQQFVNSTFSKGDILKSYISSMHDYAERQKAHKELELAFRTEAQHWLVNGSDSIPLVNDPSGKGKYWPLVVLQDKYTAGLVFSDSVSGQGYFYNITPTRRPDVKVTFPIDKATMKERRQQGVKAFVTSDPAGQIFFIVIYMERMVNGKHPATVAKIYKSDGLSWSHSFGFDFVPQEIVFVPETGALVIKSTGDTFVSVDKAGKLSVK
jgi:tetratricopeptide (TPR) repeat protein